MIPSHKMADLAPIRPLLLDEDASGEPMDVRITITLNASLLQQIEDFRFTNRRQSKSDVIRELVIRGLKSSNWRFKTSN